MTTPDVAGRDRYIIAQALAVAIETLSSRPDLWRPDSNIEDMRLLLRRMAGEQGAVHHLGVEQQTAAALRADLCGWEPGMTSRRPSARPPWSRARNLRARLHEAFDCRGETYLGWSGDPAVIMAELGRAGLTVEWDDDPATRLLARLPEADQPLP